MSIKKNFFAPLASGLGATRRAAALLLVMMLTTMTAWAQTTSTINVGGTDYTLFTGFTATDGNGTNYAKLVDGNTSTDWMAKKTRSGEPDPDPYAPPAPTGDFAGGTDDPAFVEFHADAPIVPKGYVLTCDHENAGFWKPVQWALKARLNEGDAWTTIHSSNTTLGAGKTFEIPCSNDGNNKYQYFRFEVYEVGSTYMVDLDELQFYGSLPAYTHLTVKAATCTATGIKVDCYRRNSDGKYFTDETGATELAESDVIAPMIPHSGEHHEATDVNIEYWQCSMCGKYFSDEGYTTEITEEQTKIYRTITIDGSISSLVTSNVSQALAGETVYLDINYLIDASTLKVNNGAVELTAMTDIQYAFTMPAADVTVTADVVQSNADGDVLTGSIKHTVIIPDGASITLNDAAISGSIVCEGSATITLVGTNSTTGKYLKAGIQIGGSGTTLTIRGDGSLTANGGYRSAGIGLSALWYYDSNVSSGNIVIEGGTITATGGYWGAGIGTGVIKNTNNDNSTSVQFGNVTIKGGTVTATGGYSGDGIGKGYSYSGPAITFGTVTIYDDIDKVDASSIKNSGSIVYKHKENDVTASTSDYFTIIENGNRRIIVQKVTPTIADVPDQTYTGSAITPEPLVQTGSLSLTKGTDYVYSYTNNTNVGTAKVTVTFKGDYASLGYVEKVFNIVKATPAVTAPTAVADLVYKGSAQTLVNAGSTDFGTLLYSLDGQNYSADISTATDAGTYTIYYKVEGSDNWNAVAAQTIQATILPSTVIVNVTGNGTVTYNDKVATNGEVIGVVADKGTDVTLTLAPESGYAVSIEYGYTNNSGTTAIGIKLPINGSAATLTVPDDLKDGTYVNLTVTFVSALAGGADEASAVALTDNTLTDLAGGWYKVDSNITFDHTLNLLGDTHLIIDDGKTMTVNTASNRGIYSDYTLTVSGAGALNVTTTSSGIAVCVGNYAQTGATVTASGYIGIRCTDAFIAFNFDNDFTFSGGQLTATGSGGDGIWADNDITLSCTNATDFIQASSYSSEYGAVKIADGKALTDGTEASNGMNGYSGTLTNEQKTAIGGKTLRRAVITSYVDATGTLHENVIAIPLDNTMTTLAAGWYVVNENVDYTGQITLSGDVTLILGDDCTMSFGKKGEPLFATIMECQNNNLTIYGQSEGTGWLKAYSADGSGINTYNAYTQYSGNVLIFDGNGACIYASEFTILGGTLDLESQGGGAYGEIVTTENINIRGGKLWAWYKGLKTMHGKIILDYTNATDQIRAYSYQPQNGLEIADGKTLVDDYGVIWSGTLNNYQIEQGINDRTLKPLVYSGVTLTKEDDNVSATFSGSSETTLSIPENVKVSSVTYNRTFTEGKPSTVMLPFSLGEGQTLTGGTLYKFSGVTKNETTGKWEATMTETATLQANTPYLLMPDNELTNGKVTFNLNWGTVTLNTTGGGNCETADEGSHWTFKGTYSYVKWTTDSSDDGYSAEHAAEIGRAYGFAGVEKTGIEVGDFVRAASGAKIRPMGCYLLWSDTPNAANARALTRGTAATEEELPQSITVRLVGSNGEVTSIGEIDTKTGEVTFDGWYTLDGVRLSGKPSTKGIYINNGKKVIVK